jgi:hypothetical protein
MKSTMRAAGVLHATRALLVAPAAAAAGAAAAVSGRERGLVCLSAPTRLAQGCGCWTAGISSDCELSAARRWMGSAHG